MTVPVCDRHEAMTAMPRVQRQALPREVILMESGAVPRSVSDRVRRCSRRERAMAAAGAQDVTDFTLERA